MLPSTYRDLPTFIVKPRLGPQPEGGGGGFTSSSVEGIAVLLKSFQKMFSGYIVVWV